MATHCIPTYDHPTDPGHFRGGVNDHNRVILRIPGASRAGGPGGWTIGGWTRDGEGRIEHGGPMVRGPHAYAFGLSSVCDNHGGTKTEHGRAEAVGLLVDCAEGDVLKIAGTTYRLRLVRGYPKLITEAVEREAEITQAILWNGWPAVRERKDDV